jgi:uncharacterized protein YkuJ
MTKKEQISELKGIITRLKHMKHDKHSYTTYNQINKIWEQMCHLMALIDEEGEA